MSLCSVTFVISVEYAMLSMHMYRYYSVHLG